MSKKNLENIKIILLNEESIIESLHKPLAILNYKIICPKCYYKFEKVEQDMGTYEYYREELCPQCHCKIKIQKTNIVGYNVNIIK